MKLKAALVLFIACNALAAPTHPPGVTPVHYVSPDGVAELYYYLLALYICYSMPLKVVPLEVELYLDTIAIDLGFRTGAHIKSNRVSLNKDFQNIKFSRTHKETVGKKISTFKKIWKEKIKTDPKWLEYTKTPTERVRYIISQLDNKSKVTEKTGLKYLRKIEKEKEKI